MKPFKLIKPLVITGTVLAFSTVSALAFDAVAVSAVNVRTGPSTGYAKVDVLMGGEPVTVTECQVRWCYVEHDGPDGWVSARYLAAAGAPADGAETATPDTTGSGDAAATAAAAAVIGAIIGGALARRGHTTPAPLPYGPDTCRDGYVWRDTIPGDHVCVRPAARAAAAHENAIAGSRVDP
ncbi:MAG: SH3 domain-containing protein [Rhodobacterales bacterium]